MAKSTIKLVKLINGTEIMGKVVPNSKSGVTLDDPIQINYRNVDAPMPVVSVTRYLQFANRRRSHFEARHILQVTSIIEGMERFYLYSLNNFQTTVDKVVDRELASAVFRGDKATEEDKTDMYKALLERITTDSPLN